MNAWLAGLPTWKRHLTHVVIWSTILTAILYFVIRGFGRVDQQHLGDFRHFYWAAEALLQGQNPYEAGVAHGGDRNGYIYPPLIAFLYVPLAYADMPTAAKISMIINILLMFSSMVLLTCAYLNAAGQKATPLAIGLVAAIVVVLLWDKFKGELQMLQTNMLILFAWSVALYNFRKRPWLAGLALGFAFNIKYIVLALLPYLLVRRQYRTAAYTVLGILFFALLPAVLVGLPKEFEYLGMAFGGIARLIGISSGIEVADVEPLSSGFSISIPSVLARLSESTPWMPPPLLAAGMIFIIWITTVWILYRRAKVPFFKGSPNALIALGEMTILLAVTLVFSPQTNTRHTVLTTGAGLLAVVLLFFSNVGALRPWLIGALILMVMGLTLPPGMQTNAYMVRATQIWSFYSGAMWCVLVSVTVILYAVLRAENKPPKDNDQADSTESQRSEPALRSGCTL